MGIKALKKFGQNYLIDKNIVNKMISAAEICSNSSVLEIGPGKGFITKELVNATDNLAVAEIDSRVIEQLSIDFPKVKVYEGDFVKLNLAEVELDKPLKIIGNIPFNQTGNILFKLIENRKIIENAVLIIPLDIAKRIVAKKRTKEYGILTLLFDYFSSPKLVTKVSQNVFIPKPNIAASIISIRFNKTESDEIDDKLFIKVVKASFGNRRKTLNNSLRNSIFGDCDFSKLELPLSKRAEELEVTDFLKLTKYIQDHICLKKTK
jgi:16S rRNA (adenine1518-N6/adenine1519-N6)-dimethyltransferase